MKPRIASWSGMPHSTNLSRPQRQRHSRNSSKSRHAIASSSVASEWVKGRNIGDESIITNKEIAAHLNLPPVKLHCSMLAEDAINAAIADYKAKQESKKEAEASG